VETLWETWAETNLEPETPDGELPNDPQLKTKEVTQAIYGALSAAQCEGLISGLGIDNRLVFTGVKPGGTREALGIANEDVIFSVDGRPVFSTIDLNRWEPSGEPGSPIQLVVDRAGSQITILVPEGVRPSGSYKGTRVIPKCPTD
jgi:S1-C subfamily serine protease